MKIALVSPYTLPVCRGNSLTVQRLFEGLSGRGHFVRLFNSSHAAPEDLGAFAPDIVHSLHALHPLDWLQRSGAIGACPWVATMTGTDYAAPVPHAVLRQLEESCALVVFHAEAAESVRERFPVLADRLHVIAQAVQVPKQHVRRESLRQELEIEPDELVVFMAAGLRPVKNIGYALEAFALFKKAHPHAQLLLAGPRLDEEESSRLLAAGARIEGFSYLGEVPHPRVLELLQACDIFLNTSVQEGMPGAVMEAMAAGLAVVATDVAGNRALIANGHTGMLVPLHAPVALADALRNLAASAELRQRLGRAAREVAGSRFGCEAELRAYEKLYADILSRQYPP